MRSDNGDRKSGRDPGEGFVSASSAESQPQQKVWVYNGLGVTHGCAEGVESLFRNYFGDGRGYIVNKVDNMTLRNLEFNGAVGSNIEKFSDQDLFVIPGGNAFTIAQGFVDSYAEVNSRPPIDYMRQKLYGDVFSKGPLQRGHGLGICAGGILFSEKLYTTIVFNFSDHSQDDSSTFVSSSGYQCLGLIPMLSYGPYSQKQWDGKKYLKSSHLMGEVQHVTCEHGDGGESASLHVYTHNSPAFTAENNPNINVVAKYNSLKKLTEGASLDRYNPSSSRRGDRVLQNPAAMLTYAAENGSRYVAVGYHPEGSVGYYSQCQQAGMFNQEECEKLKKSHVHQIGLFKKTCNSTVLNQTAYGDDGKKFTR